MFKDAFKYFKSKTIPPNLSNVLNFHSDANVRETAKLIDITNLENKNHNCFGLTHPSNWKIYEINEHPGLIYIKNPFIGLGQRYWICRSLRDFSKKPNILNIDVHNYLSDNEDWWQCCQNDSSRGHDLLKKLRWSTLGYHHNWNTKVYSENYRSEFPQDLASMCRYIGEVLDFSNFSAEAAIVNYYHMDSTLSGHTDHSEQNLDAPLFSFSFGQSAIFLIGGETLDVKPTALFIHSGDIVIMSRKSRLCYHAVPCIVKAPVNSWNNLLQSDIFNNNYCIVELIENCKNELFWSSFQNYVNGSRINVNVRQVLFNGQTSLSENS